MCAGRSFRVELPQIAPLRGASGECDILSPHVALRAYTVLLIAEPRQGSLPM